jgi:PAS domain S-box-containing protein
MESLSKTPYSGYIEHRAFTKNGWRWIAWSNKAILDETNQIIEIVAIGRDITYQKGVEDALRRSEDRFRTIVQQLSDIVFIIDKNSFFLYDTPSVKHVLGYNEGELLGKTVLEYVHPDDLESSKEKINELAEVPMQFIKHEFRLRHIDGRWVSVEAIGINMLQHPSINGLVITIRDITDRKQIESRILDAIIKTEEHERERFAKNLHDDLGPLLSSIKMYINAFSSANEKKKQEYIINQLNEIVKEAIITTKEVSNDLSPHILINYGLISAIDSFLKKVPSTIKVLFENELISERLSIHIENSTYRIIKELINNSLKHAQATTIKIKLTEYNNFINLVYTDNGIGMDITELTLNKSKGMGFSNIISRAKALNGIFEFQTKPKKGLIFKIKIPINQTPE